MNRTGGKIWKVVIWVRRNILPLVVIALLLFREHRRTVLTDEIKVVVRQNRQMLNARAQIQLILINAEVEGRKLTPEEVDRIAQLFKYAEYEQTAVPLAE